MDINGNDGPTLVVTKKFYCTGCKWVTHAILLPNGCVCSDVDWFGTMWGVNNQLPKDLETPFWCPFLLKKLRKEKLKELNERPDS